MPHARIFQRIKSSMSSGRARTHDWVLEFEPQEAQKPDPLMGWSGSGDTRAQIVLSFPSQEAAQAYADKYGIKASVIPPPQPVLKLQAYADNFR